MTGPQLKTILSLLPAAQHASAQERIRSAESFGWQDVRLYRLDGQGQEKSDEYDLVGESPSGETRFLP